MFRDVVSRKKHCAWEAHGNGSSPVDFKPNGDRVAGWGDAPSPEEGGVFQNEDICTCLHNTTTVSRSTRVEKRSPGNWMCGLWKCNHWNHSSIGIPPFLWGRGESFFYQLQLRRSPVLPRWTEDGFARDCSLTGLLRLQIGRLGEDRRRDQLGFSWKLLFTNEFWITSQNKLHRVKSDWMVR